MTWGFVPHIQLDAVLDLRDLGFTWVWLDGDRELAQREFLRLGRTQADWALQLERIAEHVDPRLDELSPTVIDTFDVSGERRPLGEIAQEVLTS